VQYTVAVYSHDMKSGKEEAIFATRATYVCLDDQGCKCSLSG